MTTTGHHPCCRARKWHASTLTTVSPEDAGLPRWHAGRRSRAAKRRRQCGRAHPRCSMASPGAYRDIVLLNTAAALIVADKARDLAEGASLAAQAIDSGAAKRRLEKLIAVSKARMSILDNIVAYKRDEIADAKARFSPARDRRARRQGGPAARLSRGAAARPHGKPHRPDRGDQEGEPVERPDPRRFRSPCAGARL